MSDQLFGKDPDELTLIINNREIVMESASLVKTMDTGADGFTAHIPWEPGKDSELDKITAPFSYSKAKIYLGNTLVSEQVLYNVTQRTNSSGTQKELEFASKTADIIDSTVIPPYEANYIRLSDRCKQQCRPYGINVFIGEDAYNSMLTTIRVDTPTGKYSGTVVMKKFWYKSVTDKWCPQIKIDAKVKSKYVTDEKVFPRVACKPTEKVFEHLSKLAMQRGLLLSNTASGDLLITKADMNSAPIGTIIEDVSILGINETTGQADQFEAKFLGRDRFSQYQAILKSAGKKKTKYKQSAFDKVVPTPRLLTFHAEDDVPGGAVFDAQWRRNKAAADAMTIDFPVNTWYGPDKKLWHPNTRLTIKSPTMGTAQGFTYLISRVEFKYSKNGSISNLQLKPPSVYDAQAEIIEPWLSGN